MTGLRIAVIAHALRAGGGVSVGQNLIDGLLRQGSTHRYFCSVPAGLGYEAICENQPHCQPVYFRRQGGHFDRWYFDERVLPKLVKEFAPDVVLALGNRGLSGVKWPQAILCQDSHLYYPSRHFGRETQPVRLLIAYSRARLARDLRHTNLLFCQTPVAAARLRETYRYEGEIALAPNAVSVATIAGEVNVAVPEPLKVISASTRLFCLTRYYAHKNLESIVLLFDRYREELRDVAVVLTISAEDHPNAGKLLQAIRKHGLDRQIVNVGPLQQTELAAYYRHCQALFLPTLLESFSGTYLEAMRFECPILTSDLDFAHHVCGDAALYFDPWDPARMKEAIFSLASDDSLRNTLKEIGIDRLNTGFADWAMVTSTVLKKLKSITGCESRRAKAPR
ncbi:MAG: glycosyltransferase family 4 protein [Methylococcaceae bacterium]|nr:glycosyltransferase family 4 protein [Methylococcaceae bacterium]